MFATASSAGWLPDSVIAERKAFGTVLAADGTPFKTRSGGTVPLRVLLDTAQTRAQQLLLERGSRLEPAQLQQAALAIGMAAIKYADLSNDLSRDYAFDLDRMVTMDGDTGPYLQYAHTRLATLLDKAQYTGGEVLQLQHPQELRLAQVLAEFGRVVTDTAAGAGPSSAPASTTTSSFRHRLLRWAGRCGGGVSG